MGPGLSWGYLPPVRPLAAALLLLASTGLACTPTAPTTGASGPARQAPPAAREAQATIDEAVPAKPPATLTIVAEAPGRSASEVESLVAMPLESGLNGVVGLARVESRSIPGSVTLTLTLEPGADLQRTRAAIAERLKAASGALPDDVEPLLPTELASRSQSILFTVDPGTGGEASPEELARVAAMIRRQLLPHPDVAAVELFGQRPRQLLITVDPRRLKALGITPLDLQTSLESASLSAPASAALPGLRPAGAAPDIEDLQATVVALAGEAPLHLRDLADVAYGPADPECEALRVGAGELVIGVIRPRRGAVQERFQRSIEALVREQSELLPPSVLLETRREPTVTIHVELPPSSPLSPAPALEALRRALPEALPRGREALLLAPRDGGPIDAELLIFGAPMTAEELREVEEKLALTPGLHVRDIQTKGVAHRRRLRLIGDDLDAAHELAEEVARLAETVPGVLGARPRTSTVPELVVEERPEALARLGLTVEQVARSAALAMGDVPLKHALVGAEGVPVLLRVGDARGSAPRPEAIGAIEVPLPGGGSVRLDAVADLRLAASPGRIERVDHRRSVDVDLRLAEPEARAAVDRLLAEQLVLPPGVALTWD